jgi:hypothetical protein
MIYLLIFIYPCREVAASMLPARKAMPAKTPSQKDAMRAQNQAIIEMKTPSPII